MAEEKLLTVRDVSIILGISEKEVIDLAESGQMPAYKVGGVFLRFKREQVDEIRKTFRPAISAHEENRKKYSIDEKIRDFFYFNDFYILSVLIILLMLAIIFRGY